MKIRCLASKGGRLESERDQYESINTNQFEISHSNLACCRQYWFLPEVNLNNSAHHRAIFQGNSTMRDRVIIIVIIILFKSGNTAHKHKQVIDVLAIFPPVFKGEAISLC